MGLKLNRSGRKPLHAIERENKDLLHTSTDERSMELSKQRKYMRLLRDREAPARWSTRLEAMHLHSNERTQEESSESR